MKIGPQIKIADLTYLYGADHVHEREVTEGSLVLHAPDAAPGDLVTVIPVRRSSCPCGWSHVEPTGPARNATVIDTDPSEHDHRMIDTTRLADAEPRFEESTVDCEACKRLDAIRDEQEGVDDE